MLLRSLALIVLSCELAACACIRPGPARDGGAETAPQSAVEPLIIGETFFIRSRILGENRPLNIYVPSVYGETPEGPLPVLLVLDGGLNEDFLHIAGLAQVLVSNGGMRPFLLVGIPNTNRRRDMTGPTSSSEDRQIAPVVGGSVAFRGFIREELMPAVRARYRTTGETAIIGESLAGLFVVETCLVEPNLFSACIAIDPSLWWDNEALLKGAAARLSSAPPAQRSIFIASSSEPALARLAAEMARAFEARRDAGVAVRYAALSDETHATVYHPAALIALRTLFPPAHPSDE